MNLDDVTVRVVVVVVIREAGQLEASSKPAAVLRAGAHPLPLLALFRAASRSLLDGRDSSSARRPNWHWRCRLAEMTSHALGLSVGFTEGWLVMCVTLLLLSELQTQDTGTFCLVPARNHDSLI